MLKELLATPDAVRITTPAKTDLVPYRDYIGSNLEILDIATGNATIVQGIRPWSNWRAG